MISFDSTQSIKSYSLASSVIGLHATGSQFKIGIYACQNHRVWYHENTIERLDFASYLIFKSKPISENYIKYKLIYYFSYDIKLLKSNFF